MTSCMSAGRMALKAAMPGELLEDANPVRDDAEQQILDVSDRINCSESPDSDHVAPPGSEIGASGTDASPVADATASLVDKSAQQVGTEHLGDEGENQEQNVAKSAVPLSPACCQGSRPAGWRGLLERIFLAKAAKSATPPSRPSILRRLCKAAWLKPLAPTTASPTTHAARPSKPGSISLHGAAWRTNVGELQSQLDAGAAVAKRDKAGLTALHYAAWQGSVEAVELLLDAGANVNAADPEGMLPIHLAAWFDRSDVAALLLDRGSALTPPTQGVPWSTTPLIYAAKMGHASMVTLLMERGASVAATYKTASSALHEAAWGGHAAVVTEMLRLGVSHDLATPKSGYRALHMAAMTNSASVINVLLQSGAWVDARSQMGRTPLHLACEKGHASAAATLIAGGADLLCKDRLVPVVATNAGERQYCIACVCQVRAGMVALLRAQHGYTPLHLAVDNNHVELAKLLLDKGGHPDAADTHGSVALNFAHHPDLYKLLRAVRWYGGASVPCGNNPSSRRYVTTVPTAQGPVTTATLNDASTDDALSAVATVAQSTANATAPSQPTTDTVAAAASGDSELGTNTVVAATAPSVEAPTATPPTAPASPKSLVSSVAGAAVDAHASAGSKGANDSVMAESKVRASEGAGDLQNGASGDQGGCTAGTTVGPCTLSNKSAAASAERISPGVVHVKRAAVPGAGKKRTRKAKTPH